jgi:hypothetical protein
MRQPLLVHLVFHPASQEARATALMLHAALNDDPALPGLRIPTAIACEDGSDFPPAAPNSGNAEHDVFVVLADDKMAAEPEVLPPGRMAWSDFVVALAERCRDGRHRFVPVQMTDAAWPLDPRLAETNFLRAFAVAASERTAWLARRVVVEISRFLMGLESGDKVPLRLFVSHAKRDVAAEGPFQEIVNHLDATQPIESWIDSAKIDAGNNFVDAIEAGVKDADAVLALVTTHYSTRPWCRREILLSKRHARPLVIADCLDEVDVRGFPYMGNAPVLSWRHGGAARAVELLLKEHLRRLVTQRTLARLKLSNDVVFTAPPELATVAALAGATSVLYPDPPLGDEEIEILKPLSVRVETPLQRAGEQRALAGLTVALSTSESDDISRFGAFPGHLQAALVEISRHLLIRGANLAYGGHLGDEGYTQTLFDLVRSHQAETSLPPVERIANYIGWPVPLTDKERATYRPVAKLIRTPRPDSVEALEPSTFVAEPTFFPASSPERRYAWARGMTLMRERQTADVAARVVIGGTSGPTLKALSTGGSQESWYSGRIPGVIEEALLTLRAGRPLYVCGGFGGAAGLLADLLEGRAAHRFAWDYQRQAPHSDAMRNLYAQYGVEWWDYPEMSDFVRQAGLAGLSSFNKLSADENRELLGTRDTDRIVELLIIGLERIKEA